MSMIMEGMDMIFSMKVGAEAGAGVMVIGRMAAKCFTRGGYSTVGYPEYPSLVRGGHNAFQICVSASGVHSPARQSDVVVALNKEAVFYHKDMVSRGGAMIHDSAMDISKFKVRKDIRMLAIPLKELTEKAGGAPNMSNAAALGAAFALIQYPFEILAGVLADEFNRKGEDTVKKNAAVAKAGYDYAKASPAAAGFPFRLGKVSDKRKILVGGNEACALGAVKGGMKFFCAYPMTPASSILHYLCLKDREFNVVVKQTEDEIAAMNYAIGAGFAGVRAATSTSGGGFALMTEAMGLAACSETPVVVFLVQRPGPSTGMPTWTEQGDLRFALHASQGDFPRVILAPGDVDECFALSAKAFNLAEKYQIPVVVMSDKFLGESIFSSDGFPEKGIKIERGKIAKNLPPLAPMERYRRYAIGADGVSARPFPGTPNGMHVASSYEHDERGFSSESFPMRVAQVGKRAAKLPAILRDVGGPKIYGPKKADVTLVAWGSHKLPCLDALPLLREAGIRANLMHFPCVFPLDAKAVKKAFATCKRTILVENNSTGQFGGVLKEYAGVECDFRMLRYDGRPFFAERVAEEVSKLAKAKFKGKNEIHVSAKEDLEYYNGQRYGL